MLFDRVWRIGLKITWWYDRKTDREIDSVASASSASDAPSVQSDCFSVEPRQWTSSIHLNPPATEGGCNPTDWIDIDGIQWITFPNWRVCVCMCVCECVCVLFGAGEPLPRQPWSNFQSANGISGKSEKKKKRTQPMRWIYGNRRKRLESHIHQTEVAKLQVSIHHHTTLQLNQNRHWELNDDE